MGKVQRTPTGVAGAGVSVSTISPAVAAVYRSGAMDIDDQLAELAAQFKRDAMVIDPTIVGMWLGSDMSFAGRGRDRAIFSIAFEREDSVFQKPGRAA